MKGIVRHDRMRRLAGLITLAVVATACMGGASGQGSSTTPTTFTTLERTSTTTLGLPEFPPQKPTLSHGEQVWVVVLAGAEKSDDPKLTHAQETAAMYGYSTGPTDCDLGAAPALGIDEEFAFATVSVYLSSEAEAHQALAAFEARNVDGVVAEVQAFCLD